MNIKGFFVTALSSSLDLGIATCDDVVRHVTPEILAAHLPRPLWARLLTACVGAARVDAQLVVETIGVPNLCEHIPGSIIWGCLEEIGARALGQTYVAAVASPVPTPIAASSSRPVVPLAMTPPPEVNLPPTATQPSPTVAMGPDIPAPTSNIAELFNDAAEDRPSALGRTRSPTQQRFRQSSTGIGRLAASARRPQASAAAPAPLADEPRSRRSGTESEADSIVTEAAQVNDDWKAALAVEDEQLVDWAGSEETVTGNTGDDFSSSRTKR
ncbi:MAG: hypothetical protein H0T79_24220 [Deltaproteobacteria bacterium]|nr:hypothetical protein [Deltaproteobacteria bacterium]